MAKSNAMRRLERLLDNEEYGPKLVRLNRADERKILDLIDRNIHYTKVHKELDRLDEQRRAKQRSRRSGKQLPKQPTIFELRRDAYRNMYGKLNRTEKYNSTNNRKRISYMGKTDLDYAANATQTELEDSARGPAYVDVDGTDINPFWYH